MIPDILKLVANMIKPVTRVGAYWNLSFSGAGHLMSYHLGAACTLQDSKSAQIQSVAGSSSGAIVAAAIACFPHRLKEYSSRFLQDGGRAFANFSDMLIESPNDEEDRPNQPTLHVATTNCSNGSLKLFSFHSDNIRQNPDHLLLALRASCFIPVSFHPWDIFSEREPTYPKQNSIEIYGENYVDGGIASPCPLINEDSQSTNIIISPISGSSSEKWSIRPIDTSWKIPMVGDVTARCGTFAVRPSVNNLRACFISAGMASPQVLKDWHDRGVGDANLFLEKWHTEHS